jgi:hypothetical protein
MAHLQIAGGGDGPQMCRVAGNKLNKHLRSANMRWSSSLLIGCGVDKLNVRGTRMIRKITHRLPKGSSLFENYFWIWIGQIA